MVVAKVGLRFADTATLGGRDKKGFLPGAEPGQEAFG